MAQTETVVYDRWDGGEFGTIGRSLAPPGSWTGSNAVVYRSGYIGPRPGFKPVSLTSPPTGTIRGFGYYPTGSSTDKTHWFIIGDTVYLFRISSTGITTCSTTLTTALGSGDWAPFKESTRLIDQKVWITTPTDGLYTIDPALGASAVVRIASASASRHKGTDLELYRDRLVVLRNNRVQYSDAADFTTWNSANYFDVGYSWLGKSLMEIKDTLAILTQNGSWSIVGTVGYSEMLRKQSNALVPQGPQATVKVDEEIIYIPGTRNAPVSYNGSFGDEQTLKHLETWTEQTNPDCYGAQSYGNRDVWFTDSAAAGLWRKNGVWTYHNLPDSFGPVARNGDDEMVFAKAGSGAVKFYTTDLTLDRPAFDTDTYCDPTDGDSGDLVIAGITLPDYFHPDGHDVKVRQVIVDFITYDTGTTLDNQLDVNVYSLAKFGSADTVTDPNTTNGGEFLQDPSLSSETGTDQRMVINTGQQGWGGGYRISMVSKQCVIKRVLVEIETRPSTPRR